MSPNQRNLIRILVVSFWVFIFDEIIKFSIESRLLNLEVHKNYDATFGFPFNLNFALLFLLIGAFTLLNLGKRFPESEKSSFALSVGFILGGVLGNIFDRIERGFILDYITLGDYFSFNISDLAILFGTSLLFLKIIQK